MSAVTLDQALSSLGAIQGQCYPVTVTGWYAIDLWNMLVDGKPYVAGEGQNSFYLFYRNASADTLYAVLAETNVVTPDETYAIAAGSPLVASNLACETLVQNAWRRPRVNRKQTRYLWVKSDGTSRLEMYGNSNSGA